MTTSSTPSDFTGLNFCTALGEIYGARAWRLDDYGRLRALHIADAPAWRPGVNVATCHLDAATSWFTSSMGALMRLQHQYKVDPLTGAIVLATAPEAAPLPPRPHDTPSETCKCGFYAYSDIEHTEIQLGRPRETQLVIGTIRGSGRTLIGTKGFRCEKAEVIALVDPTRGGVKTADWRLRQRELLARVYPDVPLLPSQQALLDFAPIEPTLPDPSTDEFWEIP